MSKTAPFSANAIKSFYAWFVISWRVWKKFSLILARQTWGIYPKEAPLFKC
jgi:hypothetical protein